MQWYARILVLCLVPACVSSQGPDQSKKTIITEASGITRLGDKLLIVSDDADGAYFELPLPDAAGPIIPLDPAVLVRIPIEGAQLARDIESIDVLADGRIVVLSEQSRCLVAGEKPHSGRHLVCAEYDRTLTEFGHRGLEGIAVKKLPNGDSRVAVLWEGGYPDYADIPLQFRDRFIGTVMKPVIVVHEIKNSGVDSVVHSPMHRITLNVPEPDGTPPLAQRFRASDLVWRENNSKNRSGFIVLLMSSNAPPPGSKHPLQYKFKILQRFDLSGEPVGEPLDLEEAFRSALRNMDEETLAAMGEDMSSHVLAIYELLEKHNWQNVNWEGLGWFVAGERLVTVYDRVPKDPPLALLVNIPDDWK